MQQYEQYKDSGVAWLGEVPSHWEVLSIKRLSQVKRGASPRPIDNPDYFDDNGEYAWVRIADVTASNTYLFETTQKLSDLGKMFSVPLEPDSLFLSIAGSVGKPIITKIKACIHDGFVYFPEYKNNIKFLYYIFLSGQPYLGLGKMGTQLNLNTDTVGSIKIGLPPLPEQTAIATYLDSKLGEIDRLISKQETLLEKLAEQRTAIITHTVTKGLNPDVEMKNSGVEWLGKVPSHWEVKRLRFTLELNPVKSEINLTKNTLVSFIPMEAVNLDKNLTLTQEKFIDEVYKGYTYFRNNDVVVAKITPCFENGKSAIAKDLINGIAFGTTELHVLRVKPFLNNQFLYYLIKSDLFMKIGESEMYGAGGQKRVSEEFIKNFSIGLPPLPEQTAIADYLDEQTAQIDRLSERVQQVIESLKSYRSALITQAVTGKIKVI